MKFSLVSCSDLSVRAELESKSLEISEEKAAEVLKFLESKTDMEFAVSRNVLAPSMCWAFVAGIYYIIAVDRKWVDVSNSSSNNWLAIYVGSKEITSKRVLEVFAEILDSGWKICYGAANVPHGYVEFGSLEELFIEMDLLRKDDDRHV